MASDNSNNKEGFASSVKNIISFDKIWTLSNGVIFVLCCVSMVSYFLFFKNNKKFKIINNKQNIYKKHCLIKKYKKVPKKIKRVRFE